MTTSGFTAVTLEGLLLLSRLPKDNSFHLTRKAQVRNTGYGVILSVIYRRQNPFGIDLHGSNLGWGTTNYIYLFICGLI
jgi:hypothetical protein